MNLQSEFLGIKSPNPFWLASAPPTDKEYNVRRAFEAGWGGVVWKTLGLDPNIVNVNGPRYGAVWGPDRRLLGMNNIELITDRPLQTNLDEIKIVKKVFKKEIITPGIRFLNNKRGDQKRVMTPKKAFQNGATALVVGRSITSGNIKNNIKKIIKELK